MKNNFIKTNLFSCPIYKIRIDPNSYDKEEILKNIKYNKSLKNTRNDTEENFGGCDIHHSYNDHDNVNFRIVNYEKLIVVYTEIFKEFFKKQVSGKNLEIQFGIVNYSAMTEGQWLPVHNHIKCDDFAAIHYLNFKDGHNFTWFHNPADWAPFFHLIRPELHNILDIEAPDNSYLLEYFPFPAKEDDMIIFPAVLKHQILPQGPTKEPRITISTNLRISSQEK